jgi:scyllo-inositol 2-dehydrogenase (NADP+)
MIAAAPGMTVATVVTTNPERAERARSEYPGVRVERHADALWARPEDHDFVVVTTPNHTHVPLASQAIEAGLDVVVDKPLAPSSESARGLIQRAAERGVALTAYHNRRWDSDQLTLRRLIAEGRIGDVRRYESRFERWLPEVRGHAWEVTEPQEGGGVLRDLGIHLIDQALTLFGPARSVYGEVGHHRGTPGDDDAFVAIEHDSGVLSHLWTSAVAPAIGSRLRVQGSDGGFFVRHLDGQEEALLAGLRPAAASEWGAEPEERWGRLVRGRHSEPVPSEPGAWPRFYEQLAPALTGDGPLPVDPWDAVAGLEVVEQASAS